MARKTENPEGEAQRRPLADNATAQEIQEELAYLRQKCNSLSFRGHYAECVKTIEENLKLLYFKERWPENFFSILRLHQRCYPSLNKPQSHEEYLSALLKKAGIPAVFATLLRGSDNAIVWTAEHFRDQAIISEEKGDYETALSYADILIKIDPGSSNAYLVKGRVYDEMGRADDARALYEQSLELNPNNRHTLSTLAKYYIQQDPRRALEMIDKSIEADPGEAENYGLRAAALRRLGDRDGALAALDNAQKNDPYNVDFPYQRGEIYYEMGNRVKAIPQYRMAIALDEKHVPSLLRLTEFSYDKQPDLALTYINTVHTLQPDNRGACLTRARLLQRTGEFDAAAKQYRRLLELEPQSAEANGGLGEVYLIQEDLNRALLHLEEAVRLAPREASYHLVKARAHQKLGDEAAAVAEYKATLGLDKGSARAWAELGYLYSRGKPQEAVEYFSKALALAPENAYYYTAKGDLLLGMPGQEKAAIDCFVLACKYDAGNAPLHAKLGRLLEEQGNIASAMEHYKTAIGLDKEDAETYFRLARLQMDTHPDVALLYINSAIAISVTRGDYYSVKAKIYIALGHDDGAMEQLRLASLDGSAEAMGELGELLSGNSPRLALMYINRAIELDPENAAFLCMRAHLLYQLGQKPKALEQYRKLLAVNPDQHEALFGMARILADGDDPKALEYFDSAIKHAPAVAEYHAEKAAFLARDDERYDRAIEEYAAAITLNNQLWRVILEKARLYDRHGDAGNAMAEYRRVLLLRPDNLEATARMGVMLADLSPSAALVYLNHAVALEPGNYLHYAWRGKVLYALGQGEAAEDELRIALDTGGDNAENNLMLARILHERLPETGLKYVNAALAHDPNRADAHLLRGDIHALLDEYAPARQSYEQAARLAPGDHETLEKLARVAFLAGDPDCKERVEDALENKPNCPPCLYVKARILDELENDTVGAMKFLDYAIELSPENLAFQEKLVELLGKRRNLLKLALEKYRLEKLRRKLEIPVEIPEPVVFAPPEGEPLPGSEAAAPEPPPAEPSQPVQSDS